MNGRMHMTLEGNNQEESLPNVVFVHGAWADGSSWNDVIRRLQKVGYKVTAVQIPLTSLADEVARTRQVLVEQDGPTILVGHSYGSAVITQLGTDAPNVVGLVYVAGLGPDEGETLQGLLSQGSELPPGLLHPDQQGFIWFDRDGFMQYLAPDVKPTQARVLAAVQKPIASSILGEIFGEPAWQSLPSSYLVAENDQILPPDAQRFMAQPMEATISSVASSHVALISHPETVARLIKQVARAVAAED
jgi:pimeloyl-ACP methyl ester carboxylesterase